MFSFKGVKQTISLLEWPIYLYTTGTPCVVSDRQLVDWLIFSRWHKFAAVFVTNKFRRNFKPTTLCMNTDIILLTMLARHTNVGCIMLPWITLLSGHFNYRSVVVRHLVSSDRDRLLSVPATRIARWTQWLLCVWCLTYTLVMYLELMRSAYLLTYLLVIKYLVHVSQLRT